MIQIKSPLKNIQILMMIMTMKIMRKMIELSIFTLHF